MVRFLVLNGPNINILGRRSPGIYGTKTLDEINQELSSRAQSMGVEVDFYQSNAEGHLIDCIQEHWGKIQGIIINPGALTTYGYALKDALIDAAVPVIEVHLSNLFCQGGVETAFDHIRHYSWPNCGIRVEKLYCGLGDHCWDC